MANEKAIDIEIQYTADSHNLSFYFDIKNLHRALSNLISNAIKYSAQGGQVAIHLSLDNDDVVIEISDTGIGISEADLPHIFERFYRIHNDKTARIEGTGLGLAIVKTIIEQHGGSISASSKLGQGTTFQVKLPYLKDVAGV